MGARWITAATLAMAPLVTAGCGGIAEIQAVQYHPAEAPVIMGPPVRSSITPVDDALACLGDTIRARKLPKLGIAVGDIKDFTGKYNQNEGSAVTQGGALMAYSALGKLGDAVRVHERFDTRIAEAELVYSDKRQLGDGRAHVIDEQGGKVEVPWAPYYGGTILESDYYIVGGITEVNYNIQSGGGQIGINTVGPQARVYTMNVAVDLRIVDTQSLLVAETVSLEKQITGYEVGFETFRFFGSDLFDINIGAKNQEPLQLGVRTALELGILELIAAVTDLDHGICLSPAMGGPAVAASKSVSAGSAPARYSPAVHRGAAPASRATGLPPANAGPPAGLGSADYQITFEEGQTTVSGQSISVINHIAALVGAGQWVELTLTTRDTERLGPSTRQDLIDRRIAAVTDAMAERGIPQSWIEVAWRPAPHEEAIIRDGPGLQELAMLRIGVR